MVTELLSKRRFEFPVERAIFLEVLHRLFRPGSDRAGASWRNDYSIEGTQGLALHHAYRAMAAPLRVRFSASTGIDLKGETSMAPRNGPR